MDCRSIFQRFFLSNAGQSYVLTKRVADRQHVRSRLDACGIKLLQNIGIIEDLIELFRELFHFTLRNSQTGKLCDVFYIFGRDLHFFTFL